MISSHYKGQTGPIDVETRARQSQGGSNNAIYEMVTRFLAGRHPGSGVLVDVGCGTGNLWSFVCDLYIGTDAVRYQGLSAEVEFVSHNLDPSKVPLADASADAVISVETIEHLENTHAFVRKLVNFTLQIFPSHYYHAVIRN